VEILQRDQRVALHRRGSPNQRFVTDSAHMPTQQRAYADPKIKQRAAAIGVATAELIETLFAKRRHPEQAIRGAQGILALARDHGASALESACAKAKSLDTIGYEHVRRLLLSADATLPLPAVRRTHEHVRGSDYFSGAQGALELGHAA
jgi:hypothetical protein